jgi:hypothetical protein
MRAGDSNIGSFHVVVSLKGFSGIFQKSGVKNSARMRVGLAATCAGQLLF